MNSDINHPSAESGFEPEEFHLEDGENDGYFGDEPPPIDDLFQDILDGGSVPPEGNQVNQDRFLSVGLGFYERLKEMK